MLKVYKQVGQPLSNHNGILWENMHRFLQKLAISERDWLDDVSHKSGIDPYSALVSVTQDPVWTMENYKGVYYDYVFRLVKQFPDTGLPLKEANRPKPDMSEELSREYLHGIGWVFNYYTKGEANPDYVYTVRYAPLLMDLAKVQPAELSPERYNPSPTKPFIFLNMLHVLLAVLPPRSKQLVPRFLQTVYTQFEFVDMFPEKVAVDFEGTGKLNRYAGKTLTPPVDVERIAGIIEKSVIPQRLVDRYIIGRDVVTSISDVERENLAHKTEHTRRMRELAQQAPGKQSKAAWRNPTLLMVYPS
jgi:hypothetical protein